MSEIPAKPPITAVVVCRNEAALLPRCLASLAFCDERIVVDLQSTDDSAETARRCGARVIAHEWVPFAEMARGAGVEIAANDWVLHIDPDEEVTPELAGDIAAAVERVDPGVGLISLPWRYFCKGRPLKGTIWGGTEQRRRALVHRNAGDMPRGIHNPLQLNPGYREEYLPPRGNSFLNHYWIDDWRGFFEKHWRYIKGEGEARFVRGERFSWLRTLGRVPLYFYDSLIAKRGYRDGPVGVFLSLFWSLYNFAAGLSLWRYERRLSSRPSGGA